MDRTDKIGLAVVTVIVAAFIILISAAVGAGFEAKRARSMGWLHQPCYGNNTCNANLTCQFQPLDGGSRGFYCEHPTSTTPVCE